MTQDSQTSAGCKEAGNKAYKNGDYDAALAHYTQGLSLCKDDKEKAVLLKNRAAVHLKIDQFDDVIKDCDAALELAPKDPKALFRRGQAHDALANHEKAYSDMRAVIEVDPKNKEVLSSLERLHRIVQDKIEENTKLGGKVKQMFEIVFDASAGATAEKRVTAANNLITIAREKSGSELLLEQGLLRRVVTLLKGESNPEVRIACIRTLSQLASDVDKTLKILHECGLPWVLEVLNSPREPEVTAVEYCMQCMLRALTGIPDPLKMKAGDERRKPRRPNETYGHQKEVDSILLMVTASLTNRTMSGHCRDSLLKILIKFLPYDVLDWSKNFIRAKGIEKLLEIACEVDELKNESSMMVTENTRLTTSVLLSKIYESQSDDKDRERLTAIIDEFIKNLLLLGTSESHVKVAVLLTTMLLGPLDLGNVILAKEGMLSMMLAMANSDDILQQKVSCETLIAAASKKDKCRSIMTDGTEILKRLYASKDPTIKVRALVGLCKLGSLGGSDASMKPFSDGASAKLAEACRRFLVNPTKDKDMRRWACEGLSYLTLDAEVKEKLIEDGPALRSMLELAQSGDLNCVYGVVTTLVNLCNAYDKQEIIPEMVELAKFAKQHIPEEHELDDKDFVDKRVNVLAEEGAGAALVMLAKTESENSKELIARLFLAICEHQKNRGLMVQQGATKALLHLATDSTKKGKECAAQALARIAITINPEVAFPGQRMYEVVRPLLTLLAVDCTALANFEALMGLCNIAGVSEPARQRILKEKGLPKIEHYMFEGHEMIRRAAIQCFANMCMSPDVVKLLEGPNDKMKYLFLCSADEDMEIVKAASGALCMVLGESSKLPHKIFEVKDWAETLLYLLSHSEKDVQYRGAVIVNLLVNAHKDIARKIIDTHCKEALVAVCQLDNPEFAHPKAQQCAKEAIAACVKMELITDPFAKDD
ncbi:UNC-45/Cro1/She4 central domain [Trinorchestia longiramus]|nr:UNC-45/Cro1/She4 central domain [Trinorchestia longiramus]